MGFVLCLLDSLAWQEEFDICGDKRWGNDAKSWSQAEGVALLHAHRDMWPKRDHICSPDDLSSQSAPHPTPHVLVGALNPGPKSHQAICPTQRHLFMTHEDQMVLEGQPYTSVSYCCSMVDLTTTLRPCLWSWQNNYLFWFGKWTELITFIWTTTAVFLSVLVVIGCCCSTCNTVLLLRTVNFYKDYALSTASLNQSHSRGWNLSTWPLNQPDPDLHRSNYDWSEDDNLYHLEIPMSHKTSIHPFVLFHLFWSWTVVLAGRSRHFFPRPPLPDFLERLQGSPRPAVRHLSSMFWVFPGVSSLLDMSGTPH